MTQFSHLMRLFRAPRIVFKKTIFNRFSRPLFFILISQCFFVTQSAADVVNNNAVPNLGLAHSNGGFGAVDPTGTPIFTPLAPYSLAGTGGMVTAIGSDPTVAYGVIFLTAGIVSIDVATGSVTELGTLNMDGLTAVGLAYDRRSNNFYVVGENIGCSGNVLYTFDFETQVATKVAPIGLADCITAAFFDNEGALYGKTLRTDNLVKIDTVSGEVTVIGETDSRVFAQGFDVANNTAYSSAFPEDSEVASLRSLDLTTGVTSIVAPLDNILTSLTFDPFANQYSITDEIETEGTDESSVMTFTVSRTRTELASSVDVSTSDGTATASADYAALSNHTINFAKGEAEKTVTIMLVTDSFAERDETVNLALSNANDGFFIKGTAVGTISNDDRPVLTLTVDSDSMSENSGSITATVTRNTDLSQALTVNLSSDDTSEAFAPSTVTIPADQASASFTVLAIDDTFVDGPNSVRINASEDRHAVGSALITVTDDETATVALSGDVTKSEDGSGSTDYVFTATLDTAVQGGFTIAYISSDGTASAADGDYTPVNGTVTFAGTAGETKAVKVTVKTDSNVESDETFSVALGAITGTTLASSISTSGSPITGTIVNDDGIDVVVTTSNNGGGGSVSHLEWLLGATLLLSLWRSRRRLAPYVAVLMALSLPAQAADDYTKTSAVKKSLRSLLISVGQSSQSASEMSQSLKNLNYTSISVNEDKRASSWSLGYRHPLSQRFSADIQYLQQGDAAPGVVATLPVGKTNIQAAKDTADAMPKRGQGVSMVGVYHHPLTHNLTLQTGLGVFAWQSKQTATVGSSAYTSKSDGVSAIAQLGLSYPIAPNAQLEAQWQHTFMPDKDVSRLALGVAVKF